MSKTADTNCHESYSAIDVAHYNEIICVILSHLCQQNEDIELPAELIRSYSSFATQWGYDWATVEEYVSRLQEWIVCSPECFIVAMCLMNRLEGLGVVPPISQRTVHRTFLTSLVLAVKFCEDETLCNADFAKVGCVTVHELNKMERHACVAMKFNCTVRAEEYETMKDDLEHLAILIKRRSKTSSKVARDSPLTFSSLLAELDPVVQKKKSFRFSLRKIRETKESKEAAPMPEEAPEPKPSFIRRSTKSFIRKASTFNLRPALHHRPTKTPSVEPEKPIIFSPGKNGPSGLHSTSGRSNKNAKDKKVQSQPVVFFRQESQ